jgi:hypothetical protein
LKQPTKATGRQPAALHLVPSESIAIDSRSEEQRIRGAYLCFLNAFLPRAVSIKKFSQWTSRAMME